MPDRRPRLILGDYGAPGFTYWEGVLPFLTPEFFNNLTPEALDLLSRMPVEVTDLYNLEHPDWGGTYRIGSNPYITLSRGPGTSYLGTAEHESLHALAYGLGNGLLSQGRGRPIYMGMKPEERSFMGSQYGDPEKLLPIPEYFTMLAQIGKFRPDLIPAQFRRLYEDIFTPGSFEGPTRVGMARYGQTERERGPMRRAVVKQLPPPNAASLKAEMMHRGVVGAQYKKSSRNRIQRQAPTRSTLAGKATIS